MSEPQITTLTRTVDGTTVSLDVIEPLSSLGEEVLDQFEERRAEWAERFYFWMGWCPFVLQPDGENYVVECPDFTADPYRDMTRDTSFALATIAQLLDAARKADVEPEQIGYYDDVICTLDWESSPMLQLTRERVSNPEDSGWFIQPFPAPERTEEWDPDELVRLPAWHILRARKEAGHALGLPFGVTALTDEEGLRAVYRDFDGKVLYGRENQEREGP